ncbi:MAG: TetR/AcrR family transcriptional regulator [Lachnospiraceae bacterium]|nr:TetR/AcrR family transcriptional regulator [Lachnospiraceae bacterium]
MRNSSNRTKTELREALKKLLQNRSLDKITITDLTEECGISRMAFYYHFKDIYDLMEWMCIEEVSDALQNKKTYDTWTEGLSQIFDAIYENKSLVMHAYRSISRERIEHFLFQVTQDLIMGVVEEKAAGLDVSQKDKEFIANFYKYSFVGIILDWISQGMKADYNGIVGDMSKVMYGNIANAIHNFLPGSSF